MKARRLVAIATAIATIGVGGVAGAPVNAATRSTAGVATPAPGTGPFDSPTVFCSKYTPAGGKRNSSSPGVTPETITIADNSADSGPLKRLGINVPDFHEAFKVFWNEVNKCGGIHGRKVIFKAALYNPLAPDLAGHIQARCLKITEDLKAFLVVGKGSPQAATRCIAVQHKTIIDAPANATEAEFNDSNGRVISLSPSSESVALTYIADGVNQRRFKGKKITVVGATAQGPGVAQQVKKQYVDVFKKYGIDVNLEMLPCVGVSCTSQMGNAVRRMKARGTNFVVLSTSISAANGLGALFREMRAQGLNVPIGGPTFGATHQDTVVAQIAAAGGIDAMRWLDNVGWRVVGIDKIGDWRSGNVKESVTARTCLDLWAKALGRRAPQYVEKDITDWIANENICRVVRTIARALHSVGPNLTTAKAVKALAVVKPDRRDSAPNILDVNWFSKGNTRAPKVLELKFHFPCPFPLPRPSTPVGCFMPVDRPQRLRTVNY